MKATILCTLTLTALAMAGAAGFCVQKQAPLTASAATPMTELISPTSYEQYLSLSSPTDVAATDGYIAIADGKTVYVYDRADGVYRNYVHTDNVSNIAFDGAENLYFLSEFQLYKLSPKTMEQTPLNIVCGGFAIEGDHLYYYAMSKTVIKRYSLSSGTTENVDLRGSLQDASPLTCGKDGLYYVCENGEQYALYATGKTAAIANFDQPLRSMTIANNLFCAVAENGNFYAYNLNSLSDSGTPITTAEGGYLSVCENGDDVYAVQGNSVRHYSVEKTAFTDYEITSSSASAHRLNGANQLYLAEDRLFIADDGNDRISVYNTESKSFEVEITSTLPTPFLTSYSETLLVSSAQETVLYSLADKEYGTELLHISDDEIDGNVIGAACVYDRYYLLTGSGYCYTLNKTDGSWSYTETQTLPYATAFTADVYGSLYVAYDNGALYRYTEKTFSDANANGEKLLDDLYDVEQLAVDYENNLYALTNGTLTKYALNGGVYEQSAAYTPYYGLVKDETPKLISYAFGVNDAYAYFLYEGNYIVKSDELQIPTVNPIPVGNAAERVFGAENRDFTVVTVAEDAILTEFDVNKLQGATEFPYIAFKRCLENTTALKIGEESGYSILAIANETSDYKTYLALNSACTPLDKNDYQTTYTERKTGYLTNEIPLYKFPYLTNLLTVATLPRGAEVKLLGEINKLDHAYYEIEYTAENGETVTGFIPQSYVMPFNGISPETSTVTYGETEDDNDAVWRFTYIILGLAAIGILVDFLLLYKPKNKEEN